MRWPKLLWKKQEESLKRIAMPWLNTWIKRRSTQRNRQAVSMLFCGFASLAVVLLVVSRASWTSSTCGLATRREQELSTDWMEHHHRYVQLSGPSGLREAQADLTAFQNENGKGSESQTSYSCSTGFK